MADQITGLRGIYPLSGIVLRFTEHGTGRIIENYKIPDPCMIVPKKQKPVRCKVCLGIGFCAELCPIEEVVKHAWNIGTEEQIPHDDGIKISWSKQSYTYEWCSEDAPRFVAQKLIESNLVTSEQLFDQLNPNQVIKASGITMEKLMSLFDGAVNEKPKARTLSIKK
jgi:hypothetical protein